jgi:hypothetical protein
MGEPAMRASYLRENVKAVDDVLGRDAAGKIMARVQAATLATIEAASRLAWLPIAFDVELSAAVADVAGVDAVSRINRASFVKAAEGPLLRPILGAAIGILGLTPAAIAKFIPSGWKAATRDCGEIVVEKGGQNEVLVVHEGVPSVMLDERYMAGFYGTLAGVLDVARKKGSVERRPSRTADDTVWSVTWLA